jgi:hypothetical protein
MIISIEIILSTALNIGAGAKTEIGLIYTDHTN